MFGTPGHFFDPFIFYRKLGSDGLMIKHLNATEYFLI